MFNLAIDSKLRGCDLVNLRVRDITHGNQVLARAMIVQRKTQRPVQFELTEPTRAAVAAWIEKAKLKPEQCLFSSRLAKSSHVSTRQYARIVHQWVTDQVGYPLVNSCLCGRPAGRDLHTAKHGWQEVCQIIVEAVQVGLDNFRLGPSQFLEESTERRECREIVRLRARATLKDLEPAVRVRRIYLGDEFAEPVRDAGATS